jgi:hypothetical protein
MRNNIPLQVSIALFLGTFCGCGHFSGGSRDSNVDALSSPSSPLYVHCIGPGPKIDGPSVRLLTVRVRPSEEIEVILDSARLTGSIELQSDKVFARLMGMFGSNSGHFEGEVELEERFGPSAFGFSGYISPFAFVISRSKDTRLLLKEPFFQAPAEPQ